MPTPEPLPPEVLDALRRRNAIEAITLLRKSRGLSIKEAKDRLEQHIRATRPHQSAATAQASQPAALAAALQRGDKAEAIRLVRAHAGGGLKDAFKAIGALQKHKPGEVSRGHSPGEVRDSGAGNWWFVVLGAAAIAIFYFLRG